MPPTIGFIEKHSFVSNSLGPQSRVIDLGANRGAFAMALIRNYSCRVIGVEPVPILAEHMPVHPNLVLEVAAISRDASRVTLNINVGSCASAEFAESGAQMIDVPGLRLSDLLDRHNVGRVALLKVDIEGAEVAMFESLEDYVIDKFDQITIEFHDFLIPTMTPQVRAIDARLRALDFQRIAFSLDNTDVLYLHPRLRIRGAALAFVLARYKYARGIRRRLQSYVGPRR